MARSRTGAVLITGCSTGIGRATALHLASRGFPVYASARQPETLEELAERGCRTVRLDLTDESSMVDVVAAIEAEHGVVGALVNNAGYGLEGAVEELPLDELRRQFETNLFGPTRLIQLVLPGMRRRGRGRIVNLSSVGGRITTPGNAAYHASKHALEALSDGLRFELKGFGIDVVVVEPGAISSRWSETATSGMRERLDPASPYAPFSEAVAQQMNAIHDGWLAPLTRSPELVARTIEQAITSEHPSTRYVVPAFARLFIEAHRVLPDRLWDALMRLMYSAPGEE